MTRKDYILIAGALALAKTATTIGGNANYVRTIQHALDCNVIADTLANDNPRFDRARFLTACGVQP